MFKQAEDIVLHEILQIYNTIITCATVYILTNINAVSFT